jgi:hypothetical protein
MEVGLVSPGPFHRGVRRHNDPCWRGSRNSAARSCDGGDGCWSIHHHRWSCGWGSPRCGAGNAAPGPDASRPGNGEPPADRSRCSLDTLRSRSGDRCRGDDGTTWRRRLGHHDPGNAPGWWRHRRPGRGAQIQRDRRGWQRWCRRWHATTMEEQEREVALRIVRVDDRLSGFGCRRSGRRFLIRRDAVVDTAE